MESHGTRQSISVLAVLPVRDRAGSRRLLELGKALLRFGDQYRAVTIGGWLLEEVRQAGIRYTSVSRSLEDDSATHAPGVIGYAYAILRCLQATQTDVVQCWTVRSTYAAAVAIYLLAFYRPRFPEPILVTVLPAQQIDARYAAYAHYLRYFSDALIVTSSAEQDAIARHGFPMERVGVILENGAEAAEAHRIYVEARERAVRRVEMRLSHIL
jgi:hypothetical protein